MTVTSGDLLRVIFEVTMADGSIGQNKYDLRADTTSAFSDASVLAAIETWIEDAYGELVVELPAAMTQRVCTVNEMVWNEVDDLWEVSRLVGYFTPTIAFANAADVLPNQSSAFVVYPTPRPKTRGRTFMFPFGEDQQDGTYLESTALADMADFAAEILNGISLGLGEDFTTGVLRVGVNSFQPFVLAVVTDLLGSQRRRRPGVGI